MSNDSLWTVGNPSQPDLLHIRLYQDDFASGFRVHLRRLPGEHLAVQCPTQITWETSEPFGHNDQEVILPFLTNDHAIRMLDAMWDAGLRPSGYRMAPPGALEAKEANLNDLRIILGSLLETFKKLCGPSAEEVLSSLRETLEAASKSVSEKPEPETGTMKSTVPEGYVYGAGESMPGSLRTRST